MDEGGPDLNLIVRTGLLILSIYAYFAGWLYAFYFFDHLGLSLNSIDIPAYYFFVYSYFLLPQQLSLYVVLNFLAGGVVLTGLIAWHFWGRAHWLFAIVAILILSVLVPAKIFASARAEGVYQARRLR